MADAYTLMDSSQASSCASSQKSIRPKFHAPFKLQQKAQLQKHGDSYSPSMASTPGYTVRDVIFRKENREKETIKTNEEENFPKTTMTENSTLSSSPTIPIQSFTRSKRKSLQPNVRRAKTAKYNAVLQLDHTEEAQFLTPELPDSHCVYEFQLSPNSKLRERQKKDKFKKSKRICKLQELNKRKLIALISKMQLEMAEIRKRRKCLKEKIAPQKDPSEE